MFVNGLILKPTWNRGQWIFETPLSISEKISDFVHGYFDRNIEVSISNSELWSTDDSKKFFRMYVYAKGLSLEEIEKLSFLFSSLFDEMWLGGADHAPFWIDNGNEYPETKMKSPFYVLQISKYFSEDECSDLFSTLSKEWDKQLDSNKNYYDELRYGRIDWSKGISIESQYLK